MNNECLIWPYYSFATVDIFSVNEKSFNKLKIGQSDGRLLLFFLFFSLSVNYLYVFWYLQWWCLLALIFYKKSPKLKPQKEWNLIEVSPAFLTQKDYTLVKENQLSSIKERNVDHLILVELHKYINESHIAVFLFIC